VLKQYDDTVIIQKWVTAVQTCWV